MSDRSQGSGQTRAPRPIKALKSLIAAYRGEGPHLYKFEQGVSVVIWLGTRDGPTDLVYSDPGIKIPIDNEYKIKEWQKTKIRGELVPVAILTKIDKEDTIPQSETVDIPDEYRGNTLPVTNQLDEI